MVAAVARTVTTMTRSMLEQGTVAKPGNHALHSPAWQETPKPIVAKAASGRHGPKHPQIAITGHTSQSSRLCNARHFFSFVDGDDDECFRFMRGLVMP